MTKDNKCILFIIFLFFIISICSLYCSFFTISQDNFLIKQIIWYIIGFGFVFIIYKIGNDFFYNHALILYIICNILLILLLLFGSPINNSKCWFNIKGIGTIQISEFMKIALIIFLAQFCSKKDKIMNLKEEFLFLVKVFFIFLLPSLLTFLEPDTGVVIIYFIISLTIIFTYGIRYRWFFILGGIIISLLAIILMTYFFNSNLFISIFGNSFFLRINRLLDWSNSSGYQLNRSLYTIGSANIGLRQLNINIPESQTDFIFAVFSGSFGIIASLFLLGLLFYFDYRIIMIAKKSTKKVDKYALSGFAGMLIYQQFQNIGMTLGIIPITGITLPFISYGGSSLISYMIMIGFILNSNRRHHLE